MPLLFLLFLFTKQIYKQLFDTPSFFSQKKHELLQINVFFESEKIMKIIESKFKLKKAPIFCQK